MAKYGKGKGSQTGKGDMKSPAYPMYGYPASKKQPSYPKQGGTGAMESGPKACTDGGPDGGGKM